MLEKHPVDTTKDEAYRLMVKIDNYPLPDDLKVSIKKVCAATIEITDALK